jgi:hypothetical protein
MVLLASFTVVQRVLNPVEVERLRRVRLVESVFTPRGEAPPARVVSITSAAVAVVVDPADASPNAKRASSG